MGKNDDLDNEPLGLAANLGQTTHTVDGLAWLAVTAASVVCLVDVTQESNILPLRNADPYRASIMLSLSPLITFLFVAGLRRHAFINRRLDGWIRAILCLAMFWTLNF